MNRAGEHRAGEHRAAAAALAAIPGVGPRRLRRLLAAHEPADALHRLASGQRLADSVERAIPAGDLARIRGGARCVDPVSIAARCDDLGIAVRLLGDDDYPPVLAADPDAAAVLFTQGRPDPLDRRRVGIVGTRNATASGLATARELGETLAAVGVTVVSGLARGIDAAAHRGVRSAGGPAVAVVGSGLDVPYPARNAELWSWVADAGLLVSEWPPGTAPDAWRFPQRNRILAAACEVLVVVESRERGGSLITARAALDRGIDVMAVPGSPRVRAAAGTNRLLVDGAAPVTEVADVLCVLGIDHRHDGPARVDGRPPPSGSEAEVLAVCARQPCTLDTIVLATGLDVAAAALAVARLERDGWVVESGGWFEPAGSVLGGS